MSYTENDMMMDIQMRVPLSDIRQKIRAEVIDEFLEEALKYKIYAQVFVDDLKIVAEQLKEQK